MRQQITGYDLAWNHAAQQGKFILTFMDGTTFTGTVTTGQEFAAIAAILREDTKFYYPDPGPNQGVIATS